MKKIYYTHVGKVFNTPESIVCEVVRIVEDEKLAPRLFDYTLYELLYEVCNYSERLEDLGALVGILDDLGVDPIPLDKYASLKLPKLYRVHNEYAAAFLAEPNATPNINDDLKTALSVWYWDDELRDSLLGLYHYVLTRDLKTAGILDWYKSDYFSA